MNEHQEAAALEFARKARQAAHAYNASCYIVQALREMACLPLDEWTVNAQKELAQAHTNIEELMQSLMQSLRPKEEPKPKGKVIDVESYPDPFSEALISQSRY
jgi:protein subunit release factor A